jgi:uncharacterized protein (DUF362 family)
MEEEKTKVVILKGTKPIELTFRTLEMIKSEINKELFVGKPILIKPNYINSEPPSTGITTDSRVVEGIVKFLKSCTDEKIIIGEGSGWCNTNKAFEVSGVDSVANRWNIELIDLNMDEFVQVHPPNPYSLKHVKVAKTALESAIISVPKLKLHRIATVTLSLKNMMGGLASKGSMHKGRISPKIVDLASVLKPRLSVIDGIIAGEGHETSGDPVEMNIVIAGVDPVAVDAIGTTIMGIEPREVKHLVLAEKLGLGTCNLENITILGDSIEKVKRNFRRSFSSKFLVRLS